MSCFTSARTEENKLTAAFQCVLFCCDCGDEFVMLYPITGMTVVVCLFYCDCGGVFCCDYGGVFICCDCGGVFVLLCLWWCVCFAVTVMVCFAVTVVVCLFEDAAWPTDCGDRQ